MSESSPGHRAGGTAIATLLRVGSPHAAHRSPEAVERVRALRVRSAMKLVPDGIESTASLDDAEERMDARGVNWLPVMESGQLVGLITRLDIRAARDAAARGRGR